MTARARLLAIAAAAALVAACAGGRDPLAPEDIAGTWISAWPSTTQLIDDPDTLVLDSRGGGRIRARVWLPPVAPGGPNRQVWGAAPVEYEIRRDDVFVRWCLRAPEMAVVGCTFDGFGMAGRIHEDRMLWIGPTDMASSLSALPWARLSHRVD